MLSAEEIQNGLTGAWRLMLGKTDGLRLLDLTVDGFWNSFFSIAVALPAMLLNWVLASASFTGDAAPFSRFGAMARFSAVSLGTWLIPLALFIILARHAGLAPRLVHYVVAANWGTALVTWLAVPLLLLLHFAPISSDMAGLLLLVFYVATSVLDWRLTNIAIGHGAALATAVFAFTTFLSLIANFSLQYLFGLLPS